MKTIAVAAVLITLIVCTTIYYLDLNKRDLTDPLAQQLSVGGLDHRDDIIKATTPTEIF